MSAPRVVASRAIGHKIRFRLGLHEFSPWLRLRL